MMRDYGPITLGELKDALEQDRHVRFLHTEMARLLAKGVSVDDARRVADERYWAVVEYAGR